LPYLRLGAADGREKETEVWTWLLVFVAAFVAEALGDILSAYYQTSVRKMWRRSAVKWAGCLALLSWVDLGGIAVGWPLTALIAGSVTGGMAGTYYAVTRLTIRHRIKQKAKKRSAVG